MIQDSSSNTNSFSLHPSTKVLIQEILDAPGENFERDRPVIYGCGIFACGGACSGGCSGSCSGGCSGGCSGDCSGSRR